ncbi:hypothetical protein GCK72_008596 [Caenorhabditis remanei]|uniref:Tyrosine specific protein phosphatases domain-containing protein n=1 Tax=Caenorhabditis remanei TaxID=31234 RepID=A0A6A5GZ44_CAERE|nr:hypothetical protein GCK72_008596 [Caenorhabditis remanei]KAF1760347.1 hypothetical protein GCK72_008596 [Caenorhabditis remanei]
MPHNISTPIDEDADWTVLYVSFSIIFITGFTVTAILLLWCKKLLCFSKRQMFCPIIDMDKQEDLYPPLSEDLIVLVTGSLTFGTNEEKFDSWIKLMRMVMEEKRREKRKYPFRKLPPRKYRNYSIPLNPLTSLQIIHGNRIRSRDNTVFYATQMPMEKSEHFDETRIDFLNLIWKDEIEVVVMLGPTRPYDGKEFVQLDGMYFCEGAKGKMTIGSYEVETLKEMPFLVDGKNNNDVLMRTIRITDKKKKKNNFREITHFQYVSWNDKDKPIIVHCVEGVGRTMAFIGLDYIPSHLEIHDEWKFEDGFKKLIEKRYKSFQNAQQIGWLEVGVVYFLTKKYELEMAMFDAINTKYSTICAKGITEVGGVRWR